MTEIKIVQYGVYILINNCVGTLMSKGCYEGEDENGYTRGSAWHHPGLSVV